MTESQNSLLEPIAGPAPAMEIAKDMAKRAKWILPAVIALGAFWGPEGAISSGYAFLIVVVNFLLAAWMLASAARISIAMMAGAAMFGYVLRLGLIFAAVMLVKDAAWMELVPLGITLIVTHLGLLFWELRYVSGSFAYPGLKPEVADKATQAA